MNREEECVHIRLLENKVRGMQMVELTRDQFVRILGEDKVRRAEELPQEEFENLKWDRLNELLSVYEKVTHTELFEARRSYITGLDVPMQLLLMRHVFDLQNTGAAAS